MTAGGFLHHAWRMAGAILFFLLSSAGTPVDAQPLAAASARLDLVADGTELRDPCLAPPLGSALRMNWVEPRLAERTLTVNVPICDFSESEFEVCFTVRHDCSIALNLMGPWEQESGGSLRELTVEWLKVEVIHGELAGFQPGTAWHDAPIQCRLAVRAGAPVVLKVVARVPPALRDHGGWRPAADSPAFALSRQYLRGVNLSNFLEVPPTENWGDNTVRAEDHRQIAEQGFDHVRIPVGWHHYCGPGPDYTIADSIRRRVLEQLEFARGAGLNAIVNVHHYHDFTENPQREREKLLAIWRQLAVLFRDQPLSVALEILNEPHAAATTAVMNDLYAELIPAIRRIDPERAVFVGPGNWNQVSQLGQLRLPADDRLIVTVHTYTPHCFTHQGAVWSDECRFLRGIRFPGPPDEPAAVPAGVSPEVAEWLRLYNTLPGSSNPGGEAAVSCELRMAADWSRWWNRPVHLGEFGAYTRADDASRSRYCRLVREDCERLGIGWCLWDWKAGFNYWNPATGQPYPGMRSALFDRIPASGR